MVAIRITGRRCSRCKKIKSENEFYAGDYECRSCNSIWHSSYNKTHRNEQRARNHRYYEEHGEEIKAQHHEYSTTPAGKATMRRANAKRRAQMGMENTLTAKEWEEILEEYNYSCAYCKRSGIELEQDHVIPLSRGGVHTAENIVPACHTCNSSKGSRIFESGEII